MTLTKCLKMCVLLSLISVTSQASISKKMILVGEIHSFDETHVKVRSGNQEYNFLKTDLDHPKYTVGKRIEIPFDADKMNRAKLPRARSNKKNKTPAS